MTNQNYFNLLSSDEISDIFPRIKVVSETGIEKTYVMLNAHDNNIIIHSKLKKELIKKLIEFYSDNKTSLFKVIKEKIFNDEFNLNLPVLEVEFSEYENLSEDDLSMVTIKVDNEVLLKTYNFEQAINELLCFYRANVNKVYLVFLKSN